jgi:hypothetical protein
VWYGTSRHSTRKSPYWLGYSVWTRSVLFGSHCRTINDSVAGMNWTGLWIGTEWDESYWFNRVLLFLCSCTLVRLDARRFEWIWVFGLSGTYCLVFAVVWSEGKEEGKVIVKNLQASGVELVLFFIYYRRSNFVQSKGDWSMQTDIHTLSIKPTSALWERWYFVCG